MIDRITKQPFCQTRVCGSTLFHGDCLIESDKIESGSVDLILTDLPYGTTNRNKWDIIIPFGKMWKLINRVRKANTAILLFSDEPFTSELILSNRTLFKQRINWDRDRGSGFLNAKKMLLKQTEDICLFYKKPPIYNPQMTDADLDRIRPFKKDRPNSNESTNYGSTKSLNYSEDYDNTKRYPTNLIKFSSITKDCNPKHRLHPTQKPIEMLEWLIKTYTNDGNTVLDFTMGSGSTGVACKNTNRNFIGIEKDENYYNVAVRRCS